jgi:nicotinamidase/pyrazinamidase
MHDAPIHIYPATDVLVLVDVQPDFMPGGALPVPSGDTVVPVINRLLERFAHGVATQDWHPADHASFASQYPDKHPFDTVMLPYGEQTLWPDHCVQGTPGAELHRGVETSKVELVIRKGFRRTIDSYSAFRENDRTTRTGLNGYLRERGFKRIFVAGLARGYCTDFTAEDAADLGFQVFLVGDACRGITQEATEAGTRRLAAKGVCLVDSVHLLTA